MEATWHRYPELSRHEFADGIFVEHADSVEQLWLTVSQRLPLLLTGGYVCAWVCSYARPTKLERPFFGCY